MTGKEELELWAQDAIANLLNDCVVSYGVTEREAANILLPKLQATAGRADHIKLLRGIVRRMRTEYAELSRSANLREKLLEEALQTTSGAGKD